MVATDTLLIYGNEASDGTDMLYAIDKASGREVAAIAAPAQSRYGMSTWVHEGKQYLILQTGSSLTAMTLPD
jgi:quinoprotein glucose dehydrogenase